MGTPNRDYTREPFSFLDACKGFTPELIGAYAVILELIYLKGGAIEDDNKELARWANCSSNKMGALKNKLIVLKKLVVVDGFLRNPKADKVLGRKKVQENRLKKSAKNGRLFEPTCRKINGLHDASVLHRAPGHTRAREIDLNKTNNSEIDSPPFVFSPPDRSEYLKAKKHIQPWMTEIPEDAILSERQLQIALDKNFSQSDAEHQFERFKYHHRSRGNTRMDWDAAWALWLTSPYQKHERTNEKKSRQSTVDRARDWAKWADENNPYR